MLEEIKDYFQVNYSELKLVENCHRHKKFIVTDMNCGNLGNRSVRLKIKEDGKNYMAILSGGDPNMGKQFIIKSNKTNTSLANTTNELENFYCNGRNILNKFKIENKC